MSRRYRGGKAQDFGWGMKLSNTHLQVGRFGSFYEIARIEAVRVEFSTLYRVAFLGAGLILFGLRFLDMLYVGEAFLALTAGLLLLAAGCCFASLTIESKARGTEKNVCTRPVWTLIRVSHALLKRLEQQSRGRRSSRHIDYDDDEF
ncbi:MAG: hypothetical protein AAGA97_00925 [Pseudomonadota bacterium]